MPIEIPPPITFSCKDTEFHNYADFVMPFGKHKGKSIDTIWHNDNNYIFWLHDKATLNGKLARAINHYVETFKVLTE
jgi:uncharacterized protein (DUF3820 family)